MREETEVAISITPDGKRMQREEVVEYLKNLSEHILLEIQLEEHISDLREKLADMTKEVDLSHVLPSEPMPPVMDKYPKAAIAAVVFFLLYELFLGRDLEEQILVIGGAGGALILSLLWHQRGNRKAMADWQERKSLYDAEAKRIAALDSRVEQNDPPEVLEVKQELQQTEDACRKIQTSRSVQENQNVLASEYRKGMIPCILYSFFLNGRANTLSEAINLFHVEIHQQSQIQEQERMREEILMHQDAILRQQNLNVARLSNQIEEAKNELELDILLDSLYTAGQIDALRRELNL